MAQLVVSEFYAKRVHPPIVSIVVTSSKAKVGFVGADAGADSDVKHGL